MQLSQFGGADIPVCRDRTDKIFCPTEILENPLTSPREADTLEVGDSSVDVKLIVVGGKHPGQEIPAPGPKFFIGRAEDCQLRPRSEMVSRHHCVLLVEEGFVAVRDFGSKNGTFVNGEQVKAERELKAGDRLRIGPLEFDVQLTVSVSGKKKPKVHNVQEAAARTVQTSAGGQDADIAGWLEDGAETVSGDPSRDAASGAVASAAATTPAPQPAGQPDVKPPKQPPVEKPDPLLGPAAAKPSATSSRSAAEEMLKQFFHRKP
jgi:pSer/pThr/pTyr-binding forkhead associated (FHA) protein